MGWVEPSFVVDDLSKTEKNLWMSNFEALSNVLLKKRR